ncbi:MAG: cyclic nucleotide-binding domain-containing protein [Chrysiogenales bacterium]|nr:MAG: cyclic nucleotide-binding domain-containing protein [Chrysiogenales bacterium]
MKDRNRTLYKAGSYIYIEGDEDVEEVFIVEKGHVEFKSSNERVNTHGNNAGPGDVFGFISSLSRRPRMETAFAKVTSSIVSFSRERFLSLLQKNSDIALKLINSYAEELRVYDTMIFPLEGGRDMFLPQDIQLFELGSYYHVNGMKENATYVMSRYMELFPDGPNVGKARDALIQFAGDGMKGIPPPVTEGIYRRYPDRQIIFCEHEPGDELFIIKEGRVKIVKFHGGSEIILSILKEGDIFGELAIVSNKPRNATAISFGATILLPINEESLMKLIRKSSDLLKRIFTAVSQRVWFTFIRTESKFYEKPITRIYAFLENKLIEENISLKSREPHAFNFGIDELLKMSHTPASALSAAMAELTRDQNLKFQFGQTVIDNSSLVASKARYYKARDHLYEGGDNREKVPPSEDLEPGPEIPFAHEGETDMPAVDRSGRSDRGDFSTLFDELESEVEGDKG